jgi:hypothetical protein
MSVGALPTVGAAGVAIVSPASAARLGDPDADLGLAIVDDGDVDDT